MTRWIRNVRFLDYLSLFILSFIIIGAYSFLFFPESRIFVTPDRFLSDILHFNLPLKHLLALSIRNGSWPPIWTHLIGTGFPLLGEAEIGAFSVINILLVTWFPEATAFSLISVASSLLIAWACFAIGRMIFRSHAAAFFFAIAFTFTGFLTVQIPHQNHLQTLGWMLIYFSVLLYTVRHPGTLIRFLIPLTLSQSIFAGHFQYVFMGGVVLILSWIFYFRTGMSGKTTRSILILSAIGILLAAIQLIPSFEFFTQSNRILPQESMKQGMNIDIVKQFVDPFALGDIRNGSFPLYTTNIAFWETFPYVGRIPLVLFMLSFFFLFRHPIIRFGWGMTLMLFLLAFEQTSPFYVIFSFPPFSFFHVHSRFIAFAVFFLLLSSSSCFTYLIHMLQKKFKLVTFLVTGVVVLFTLIDLLSFFRSYHPTLPSSVVFEKPKLFEKITSQEGRVFPLNPGIAWSKIMQTEGWSHPEKFASLMSDGTPDATVLWNIKNAHIYSGFSLTKQTLTLNLLYEEIHDDMNTRSTTISPVGNKYLDLLGITMLVSIYPVDDPTVTLISSLPSSDPSLPSFYLYERKAFPLVRIVKSVTFTPSIEQFQASIQDVNLSSDAYISDPEQNQKLTCPFPDASFSVTKLRETPYKRSYVLNTPCQTYAVIATYFYPGWQATIDGKKTSIYPANISSLAVKIPEGSHTLTLEFIPKSLYVGAGISLIGLLWYLALIIGSQFPGASPGIPVPSGPRGPDMKRMRRKGHGKAI